MRLSQAFSQTQREIPAEADTASYQLLIRAGYIRPLAAGIFALLPLGYRAINKIADVMRAEMNAIGGQEMQMPVVNPAEIWQSTGRWGSIGSELNRFKDRNARDFALAMTHEESVAFLTHAEIHTYRQLPQTIYHIQTKWRDDPRPRAGMIRAREFTMLDSYSLDRDDQGLEQSYADHMRAYQRIFERVKLPVSAVQSDVGMMGGSGAHEWMYLTPIGEDTLLFCSQCDYSANRQIARWKKTTPASQLNVPLQEVATPQISSIADLCSFLRIKPAQTAKAVFFMAEVENREKPVLIFSVVRGDREVNEYKLAAAVRAISLRPAQDDEIRICGAVPGYASPIGVHDCIVVVDDLIPCSPNLVAGANKVGFHLMNVNYQRDYTAQHVADISNADENDAYPICASPLLIKRGVEVGNTFKLGTRYSIPTNCKFTDEDGHEKPVIMGSYGIGLGRLLSCVAEEHHDERGLCLPLSVAPYQVHLISLAGKDPQIASSAEMLYSEMLSESLQVLFDDRAESPGVKFNDADLIGLPLRITISQRSLAAGGAEFKARTSIEQSIIPLSEVIKHIHSWLKMRNEQE